jgi:hypothetical protein
MRRLVRFAYLERYEDHGTQDHADDRVPSEIRLRRNVPVAHGRKSDDNKVEALAEALDCLCLRGWPFDNLRIHNKQRFNVDEFPSFFYLPSALCSL